MVKPANEKRGKWIDYFDLLDALKKPGCPLCNRINELSLRFLDNLFYERVTDVGTRVNLAKAKGFCNWHAWMSMEVPNSGSGIAIIYKISLIPRSESYPNGTKQEVFQIKGSA